MLIDVNKSGLAALISSVKAGCLYKFVAAKDKQIGVLIFQPNASSSLEMQPSNSFKQSFQYLTEMSLQSLPEPHDQSKIIIPIVDGVDELIKAKDFSLSIGSRQLNMVGGNGMKIFDKFYFLFSGGPLSTEKVSNDFLEGLQDVTAKAEHDFLQET